MAHLNLNRIDLAFGRPLLVRQLSLSLETGRIGCLLTEKPGTPTG